MSNETLNWYAVYTRSRFEKKIHTSLIEKSIETYLPLYKKLKQWSDRKKWVEEPLIPSYIFVKISEKDYYNVLNTPGVVRYITFSGKPAPIPEKQIDTLKKLLTQEIDIELTCEKINSGEEVEIVAGGLIGLKGELVEYRGNRKVLIKINHLEHSLLLNIPLIHIRRVE